MSGKNLSGSFSGSLHRFPVRVYYEDTDAGGIVYYANYLRFAERARTEMIRILYPPYTALVSHSGDGDGFAFAVRSCAVDYLAPAALDDLLTVESAVTQVSGARLHMAQRILRGETPLVTLTLGLACIRSPGKPSRIPAPLAEALNGLISSPPPHLKKASA